MFAIIQNWRHAQVGSKWAVEWAGEWEAHVWQQWVKLPIGIDQLARRMRH